MKFHDLNRLRQQYSPLFVCLFVGMGLANWLLPACSPHICREKWLVKGDCGRNMGRIDGSFTRN